MVEIRTRIAPSPTGNLHLGTVRTALYNLLFARSKGGKFYFRLEDTDAERSKHHFTEEIVEGFRHLGIDWDIPLGFDEYLHTEIDAEGIIRQSLRAKAHISYINKLLSEGKAYKCFASPEELTALREEQIAKKLPQGYDNRGRKLSADEIKRFETEERPCVIRLNLGENREIKWDDVMKGPMSINTKDLGGDPVIMKSTGQVLYNFAVVADDVDMGITHVFRGEDHLSNTAKQIVMYEALNAPVPIFGHLPLIFTTNKEKLSKRKHGDIAGVDKYRNEGYIPDALVNYLIATSYTPQTKEAKEVYTIAEAIKDFDVFGLSKSPAIYDIGKLNWYNREYIAKLSHEELMDKLQPFLKYEFSIYSDTDQRLMIEGIRGNLNKFADINENIFYLFEDLVIPEDLQKFVTEGQAVLKALLELAENNGLDFTNKDAMKDSINKLGEQLGLKGKQLFWPIRIAISGVSHGPDLGLVMYLLGKDRVIDRLKKALELIFDNKN